MPVDWATAMYYGVGLNEISTGFSRWMGLDIISSRADFQDESASKKRNQWWVYGLALLSIFSVGASLPLAEKVIPVRYTPERLESRVAPLLDLGEGHLRVDQIEIWQSVTSSGGDVMQGRAIYPRYFSAGTGTDSGVKRAYNRFEFYLSGSRHEFVELETATWWKEFPHGSDVVLLGCSTDLVSIAVYEGNGKKPIEMLWRDGLQTPVTCPLPGE